MSTKNKNSGLYSFLYASGVLEKGTSDDIKNAKRAYWLNYKKDYKRQKLKDHKRLELLLNQKELEIVKAAATKQGISITRFIKQNAVNGHQCLSSPVSGKIREQLFQYYNDLENLMIEQQLPKSIIEQVLSNTEKNEEKILELIQNSSA